MARRPPAAGDEACDSSRGARPSPGLLAGGRMRAVLVRLLILPIRGYRLVLSPWLGQSCRFQPTCSAYAIEALEIHGPVRGLWRTLRRLARCNPFGGSGYDPVPHGHARGPRP